MKYLIEIAIGPVQEFIASARKLRDLWFGSRLLSELSKCVAKSLKEQGCSLIFPAPEKDGDLEFRSDLIVANKVLVEYEGDCPRDVVNTAKENWKSLFRAIADETIRAIEEDSRLKKMNIQQDLFNAQVDDFGEFFAAWVPVEGDDYGAARHKVEQLLAGRKSLREFDMPQWEGFGVPKNSLDGMRETVIGNKAVTIPGLLKRNEKLDAIGLIKRFWPLRTHKKFDDLSDVSSKSWFAQVYGTPELKILMDQFASLFEAGDSFPTEAIYIESNDSEDWKALGCGDPERAWTLLKDIKETAGNPMKYSCILLGDGDNMGAAIGKIKSKEGLQGFTKELSTFASQVEIIVEENDGCLIYAGGDDVMAIVPLETALKCADELRKEFASIMKRVCDKYNIGSVSPTFSVGMAIVHHQEPLSNVLDCARMGEKIAKNEAGKNALALIQNKRSGAPLVVSGKWDAQGELKGFVERMELMIERYRSRDEEQHLPSNLGYQLREARIGAGDELEYKWDGDRLIPLNAQSALVQRIFLQKKGNADSLIKDLLMGRTSIRKLSDELVIAHQLSGANVEV
ncbi:MAG: type III-B CRISPR-associated protein Cas10/Cmr2 [Fibrobacter sp.]|nr:type III-B CRISPR-associated protein Cas10/Cmr2 [Fibrobacter sp.]